MRIGKIMFSAKFSIFLINVWFLNIVSSDELGYCAPYNGKICKQHISGVQVW